ncbi:MAG: cation:proton antiporter [Coraliomargarita sp.]
MEQPDLHLLLDLGYIAIAAAVFAFLGKLIRMPSLVAYILAGMALGPGFGWVLMDNSLELISELGIALLLFLVGLELSFEKVRNLGKPALILGSLQVLFTCLGAFALSLLMGFGMAEAILLAAAATFSSTVVVIKLLDQKGDMKRLYARLAVGLFLFQDIVVIAALTLISGLDGAESISLTLIIINESIAFAGMLLLLAVAILASRYLLPKPFAWAARFPDTLFIWALCWCFLMVLLAHAFHLSVEVGAFLAGIAIAQLPVHEDLHRRLHPLMTFFIAVFLVTLGVELQFESFGAIWGKALILTFFVLLVKPLLVFGILSKLKFGRFTCFQTAVASGQMSEFSFILLGLAYGAGLVSTEVAAIGGLVGILSISISSYLIIYSERLFKLAESCGVFALLRAQEETEPEDSHTRSGHIIVVGMNAMGREIVKRLVERGEKVLAIDTDPQKLRGLTGAITMIGNVEYHSVVEEIGLRRARMVVSALQIEDANNLLAYRCRAAEVPCAIHAFDDSVVEGLLDLNVNYLMMPAIDGAVAERRLMKEEGLLGKAGEA